ncbi:hypothetical protein GCM10007862_17330 [Dyella lipolytica]|uniref:CPBP family intramembrane metalloprotease n=1 Tax=Dyella lipolytica TaxID=1867835 RepID=A0ABW8ISX0_9GAMM|nr:CPBP family intramembrane glutamic endopeptidase [Dyella lipolytica]GLQ46682.1 hypothetical protein GCM10007862_17330 [Dyella lipolytica]
MSVALSLPSTRRSNLKLALVLSAFAVIATLALQPYLVMTAPAAMSKLHVPFLVIAVVQAGVPCLLLGWLGLSLGLQYGLDAPWLRAFVYHVRPEPVVRTHWRLAAFAGVLAGALAAGLAFWGPRVGSPIEGMSRAEQAWRGALASLYGGTAEEILLRLFMVSLLVWLLALFNRRQTRSWMFVLAIILAALLFGVGHLPYAFTIGMSHTPMLIGKIVLLNALVGLVTGSLFWKYGLEHAMLAHFCADLVLHVAVPLMGY